MSKDDDDSAWKPDGDEGMNSGKWLVECNAHDHSGSKNKPAKCGEGEAAKVYRMNLFKHITTLHHHQQTTEVSVGGFQAPLALGPHHTSPKLQSLTFPHLQTDLVGDVGGG